jgi:hypothetical protein
MTEFISLQFWHSVVFCSLMNGATLQNTMTSNTFRGLPKKVIKRIWYLTIAFWYVCAEYLQLSLFGIRRCHLLHVVDREFAFEGTNEELLWDLERNVVIMKGSVQRISLRITTPSAKDWRAVVKYSESVIFSAHQNGMIFRQNRDYRDSRPPLCLCVEC